MTEPDETGREAASPTSRRALREVRLAAGGASGQADPPTRRRVRRPAPAARRVRALTWGVVAAALVLLAVLTAVFWPRGEGAAMVTVAGIEFTSTIEIREENGVVYAYLPVNADLGEVVLRTGDRDDDETIRATIDAIDVFTPGEHVIMLKESAIHVIVDGIADEG